MLDSEESVKLLSTIAALRLLLIRLYGMVYKTVDLTPEQILFAHDTLRQSLLNQSLVRTNDPVPSDMYSAEIAAEIDRLLQGIEEDLRLRRKESR